jgi:hypothetical protein
VNFSSLGLKFKLIFELKHTFELQSFESTKFYCIYILLPIKYLSKNGLHSCVIYCAVTSVPFRKSTVALCEM